MRIDNNGDYAFCRWQRNNNIGKRINIQDVSPLEYFQKHMSAIRMEMFGGQPFNQCKSCHVMEEHGKISGRQKQLLKIGVDEKHFKKSLLSSPLFDAIDRSYKNNGNTELHPVDWQIDLGNFCNSACIMCAPKFSSKLANEWHKLGFIDTPYDTKNWASDDQLLNKFIGSLTQIKNLKYLHFLGGETLLIPAFKKILQALVDAGLNKDAIIGFTTNLTVWPQDVIDVLKNFAHVHVGVSIETLNSVNDYIRWPSKIAEVKENLAKFIALANDKDWFTSLRVTPNLFSVYYIDALYEFAFENSVGIESCNFIHRPAFLKIDLLPTNMRKVIIEKLQALLNKYANDQHQETIINVRQKKVIGQTLIKDIQSIISYLQNVEVCDTEYKNLLNFIKIIEQNRGNSIIEHAPEYEKFLRDIGY